MTASNVCRLQAVRACNHLVAQIISYPSSRSGSSSLRQLAGMHWHPSRHLHLAIRKSLPARDGACATEALPSLVFRISLDHDAMAAESTTSARSHDQTAPWLGHEPSVQATSRVIAFVLCLSPPLRLELSSYQRAWSFAPALAGCLESYISPIHLRERRLQVICVCRGREKKGNE